MSFFLSTGNHGAGAGSTGAYQAKKKVLVPGQRDHGGVEWRLPKGKARMSAAPPESPLPQLGRGEQGRTRSGSLWDPLFLLDLDQCPNPDMTVTICIGATWKVW